jgi:apolipoprotein N-acyltransferase
LVPAALLLLISNGANTVPVAAWLAPILLLRFVRTQAKPVGLLVAYPLLATSFAFQFRGMVPIPGIGYYIFLACFGIPMVLPYALDRLAGGRLSPVPRLMLFPLAWAATEFLISRGPYGSWGAAAYSQYGNLPLIQVISVTGMWGISFLMGWCATTVNFMWEQGWSSRQTRKYAVTFAATLLSIVAAGGARLAFLPPAGSTIRIASLSKREMPPQASPTLWQHVLLNTASEAELAEFGAWAQRVNDDLSARAEREAQAGAKVVFWGEGNAMVFKPGEPALIARGRELAAKYQIYLGMALATWNRGERLPLENKLILIRPDGSVAWEYYKAHPVPGGEAAMSVTTDGKLRFEDAPFGRMSSVICFDADFPRLLAQAGALSTGVLLDPSNDWKAIDPWHTQMASFRAVEQGFNLVRHTSQGFSAAYDYQGRQLAAMDHYRAADLALVSQVPTRGVRTLYSRLGDWFGWLCLAGVLGMLVRAVSRQSE